MLIDKPQRSTTEQRAPWWRFTRLATRRMRLIQRAGRLTAPKERLTLTLSANWAPLTMRRRAASAPAWVTNAEFECLYRVVRGAALLAPTRFVWKSLFRGGTMTVRA